MGLAMTNLLGAHTDFAYWNPDLAPRAPEAEAAAGAPPGDGTDESGSERL